MVRYLSSDCRSASFARVSSLYALCIAESYKPERISETTYIAPALANSVFSGMPGRGEEMLPPMTTSPTQTSIEMSATAIPCFQPNRRGPVSGMRSINKSPVPPCPPLANRYTKNEAMTPTKTHLGTVECGLLYAAHRMPSEITETERSMTPSKTSSSLSASIPKTRVTTAARATAARKTPLLIDESFVFIRNPASYPFLLDSSVTAESCDH